jgi:tetratricopeptide (TPR) repeat protein
VATQDERLAAIAAAAAATLRDTPYHVVRAGDVAAAVRLPGETGRSAETGRNSVTGRNGVAGRNGVTGRNSVTARGGEAGRSAVWLYNEVRNRRVLVALAAAYAWREFPGRVNAPPPGPIESVTAARSAAAAALGVIVAFHRAEQALMTQVGYGIGDISTAEKRQLASGTDLAPPSWPDSSWGRVAAAAWHGRCEVFTDFLRPVLRACAESVTYLAEPTASDSAARLSDIAFRTCLADREAPVDLVARGLAALWFDWDLARVAGTLARDLESSETALATVARRSTDPRAEASASAVVVRVLLEAGTLHERCMTQAQRTVSLWQDLAAKPDESVDPGVSVTSRAVWHDLQRLSDAASHLGLAAARYGDRRSAADAWRLSRRVAERELAGDLPRMTRADTNLAALAAEAGRVHEASSLISGVFSARLELVDLQPENAAAWRRLTVTARARADIARVGGRVVESVRLAADLLADRQARLRDPAHADVAEARLVLGQALLAAGQPVPARRYLEEAAESRRGRFLPASYRVQEDLLWLVRAALVLEHPQAAVDLLAKEAAATDWFGDRVSFRLGYTARRLLALAGGRLGRTDEAAASLLADRERLADRPLCVPLDPLVADFDRSLGEVALLAGDFAGGLATLAKLAEAEAEAAAPLPARGWTLVLLGRAADRLGDARRAARCFDSVADLAAAGIDPSHPVILAARYDQAVRSAATGDTGEAAGLLEPVLDRTPLTHGHPALGEAHPLLARARALAQRLGITVPDPVADADDASLDIDVLADG